MKNLLTLLGVLYISFFNNFCYSQNLPYVSMEDKSFSLFIDKFDEQPLVLGFLLPDVESKKMICFSSYTSDVENNPYKCELGAYYDSSDVNIEFVTIEGNFVKLKFKKEGDEDKFFYIEKEKIRFQ